MQKIVCLILFFAVLTLAIGSVAGCKSLVANKKASDPYSFLKQERVK